MVVKGGEEEGEGVKGREGSGITGGLFICFNKLKASGAEPTAANWEKARQVSDNLHDCCYYNIHKEVG